ncbi:hypothetical protein V5097_08105 [Arenibacter palladensis]|uniref:hypothetical protein n=1 Tax=Arenibacter palladensis TaxID=237373 RepID=UPI002FD21D86
MFPNQITAKTLVIIMALGSLSSCKEQPKANIAFLSLSEQEKRNPEYALASMEVAEGLYLELFASEPMVTNPTNMAQIMPEEDLVDLVAYLVTLKVATKEQ